MCRLKEEENSWALPTHIQLKNHNNLLVYPTNQSVWNLQPTRSKSKQLDQWAGKSPNNRGLLISKPSDSNVQAAHTPLQCLMGSTKMLCSNPIRNYIRLACLRQALSVCSNSLKCTPTCGGTDCCHFNGIIICHFVKTLGITNHRGGTSMAPTVNLLHYFSKAQIFSS